MGRIAGVLLPLLPPPESPPSAMATREATSPLPPPQSISQSSSANHLNDLAKFPSGSDARGSSFDSLRPSDSFDNNGVSSRATVTGRSGGTVGRGRRHSGLFEIRGSEISVNLDWEVSVLFVVMGGQGGVTVRCM